MQRDKGRDGVNQVGEWIRSSGGHTPLIRLSVLLAIEDVAEVRATAVADDLEPSHVPLDTDMAVVSSIEAHIEGVPAAVLELGSGRVERLLACAAREVALLWKKVVIFCGAQRRSSRSVVPRNK